MKVLFIQHVSVFGGSSRSLLELIDNLPKDVNPSVLCPKGEFSNLLEKKGIKVFNVLGIPQFDNTRIGHYRKLRWLILIREIFYLPFLFFKILELKKEKFDAIHINDITQIYSLIFAKKILNVKTILHVRAMMSTKKNVRYKILLDIFKKYADQIIAIDETVKSTLDTSLNVKVLHNGMSMENIHINKNKNKNFTVGIVANFQRYKGILEFIDAAHICINKYKLDIDFVVYGAEYNNTTTFKEKLFQYFGFRENLEQLIKDKLSKYNFGDSFKLMGYIHHADDIYNYIDLLTFPSHLNAVGRPVFEAAFYKIPSIVAIENEIADTIVNNGTGICIQEKDATALANAIERLYINKDIRESMGEESYKLANTLYNSKKNSLEIYSIYSKLLHKESNV